MELSTCFALTLECRTVRADADMAEEEALYRYWKGCADVRHQPLHAAVVELVALDNAEIKYSRCRTGMPDENSKGGIYNFCH